MFKRGGKQTEGNDISVATRMAVRCRAQPGRVLTRRAMQHLCDSSVAGPGTQRETMSGLPCLQKWVVKIWGEI